MDDPQVISLIPAVQEQLQSPETLFVAEAVRHLLEDPEIQKEEAHYMVAFCLADELEKMLLEDRPFDLNRYQMMVKLLPTLPE